MDESVRKQEDIRKSKPNPANQAARQHETSPCRLDAAKITRLIGVSTSLNTGKLTNEEFEIKKTHSELGSAALSDAEAHLGSSSFPRYAREITLNHHEKWDGSGYPAGLQGEQIPVSAPLMAVADLYDALISKRVYKPAFPHEKALELLTEGRGSHFDPEVYVA